MKNSYYLVLLAFTFIACKGKKDVSSGFEVNGKITNNTASMVYLEQVPMATMQAIVLDSAKIEKDGSYSLHAPAGEATVYNLRLDKSSYPFAAVINDAKKLTVDVSFSKDNKEFPDKYDVKGSESSQQMKDFMFAFNSIQQSIYFNATKRDSLQAAGADSAITSITTEIEAKANEARKLLDASLAKSKNAALSMFELGYYQTSANNPPYQLIPLSSDEVKQLVNELEKKYPSHSGIAAIKRTLQGLVGLPAPEITSMDPTGKPVSLSSYKGKYVLVDFWASWCKPCRDENPNVVKAYNRFKDKTNFAILGVSLDRPGEKNAWTKAIMEDKLTWNHVSDLMFWDSPVVAKYKIDGIPYNVLVDPNGNVIAEKLFGKELEDKLAEVLK